MVAKRGTVVVEGLDVIIKRDLDKHKFLLNKNNLDLQAIETARSHEISRKKFYTTQKGKRNYNDEAMEKAIAQMNDNIGLYSIQVKSIKESRTFNTNIVDTLTKQLEDYYKQLSLRN
tara:strand:+ start:3388 stop:3738 length:351 start_codon:yes stop_codon:yes gene_type:complete